MRTLLLLLLLVSAPAAQAQAPRGDDAAAQTRAAEIEEKRISDEEARRIVLAPLAAGRTASRDEVAVVRRERAIVETEIQDRSQDFLWHVLLTAVSALITALIWKAIN